MHLRDETTAVAQGVDEIGFTEHVYVFEQTRNFWRLPYQSKQCEHDLDVYVEAVTEAKERGLPVKLGLEIDRVGERADELAECLAPYPFDYLLGSVHWLDGRHGVEGVEDDSAWAKWPEDEVWPRYVAALCAAAASGHFDVLSYSDLAKIHAVKPARVGEAFDEAIAFARECGRDTVSIFERRERRQEPLG